MKVGALVRGVIVGTLSFMNGCGQAGERVKPSWLGLGLGARQVKGSYHGLKIKTAMPVSEIWVKKELTNQLDLYGLAQFTRGTLSAEHGILEGQTTGNFGGVGLGLNYFPLSTRLIGFDTGVEAFWAEHEMRGGLGPLKQSTTDQFNGGGFHLGALGEIALFKNGSTRLIWGAGYNFTQTDIQKVHIDLDGWYATIGIEIKLND